MKLGQWLLIAMENVSESNCFKSTSYNSLQIMYLIYDHQIYNGKIKGN